jgi:hypothetical protein
MEDILSWLPIIIAIFVALSSAGEKGKGKPGTTRPYLSSPWAKGFEPSEIRFPKWLTEKIPGIENLLSNNENKNLYPSKKTVIDIEGTSGVEGTEGIEGTPSVEGVVGIEGTSGIEGTFGNEISLKSPVYFDKECSSESDSKQMTTIPNNEELIRAVVWAEILNKPKALRGRK